MRQIFLLVKAPVLMLKSINFYRKLPEDIKTEFRKLRPNDIVIDIGANVGVISWLFLWKKCHVIAIEPHPLAFQKLKKRFGSFKNITMINSAISVEKNEFVKLFLHTNSDKEPSKFTLGSSLRSDKPNVGNKFIEVPNLDPLSLLRKFERIRLLKIDIEGYEVELLPFLLRSGELAKVESVFVELHDMKWPSLSLESRLMIKEFEENQNHGKVFWNWP